MPRIRYNHLEALGFRQGDLKRPRVDEETSQRGQQMEVPEPCPPPPPRTEKMIVATYRENHETPLAEQVDALKARIEEIEVENARLTKKKWWQFWIWTHGLKR